jgi:endonuclease-8
LPEGDTIHRAAATLDRALAGKVLVRFEAPRLIVEPFPPGVTVEGAVANGKHCLIRFDDGRTLRTHMRMTGSWHLYKPGERWRKKGAAMRALVAVEDWIAVCFAAPEVELVREVTATDHLGPDLCVADPDIALAARLLGELSPADREIGDALLDQRIACGVGNIWKSETLFAEGVDPFTPVGALPEGQRVALLLTAARLLREQVVDPGGRRNVYGRRGQPCLRCGTTIAWRSQGPHRRGTYWCPTCQR